MIERKRCGAACLLALIMMTGNSAWAGQTQSTAPARPPSDNSHVPVISPQVVAAAHKINADPVVKAIVKQWNTPENIQERFDQHKELVRIAGPSRHENRRATEIMRRMVEEWGFSPNQVTTQKDGYLPGSDVQRVDGLPVYNECVVIKGSYPESKDAKSYKGQYPKILVEGHIDAVNPATLPPADDPYLPIKLQPMSEPVVSTPEQLAAISRELHFDASGHIIHDDNYRAARHYFADKKQAKKANALRMYVPGFGDDMGNASNVMMIARAMNAHHVKPVYDIWFCNTAGEEGKGNLAGMKQLYGYDQNKGTGTNPLNFVANFGLDAGGSGTVNFIGSYRFEIKYKAPAQATRNGPGAVEAAAASIARIARIKTSWDKDRHSPKVTYTVGTVRCADPEGQGGVVPSCSIQVDMRAPTDKPLNRIRHKIEPLFQAGVHAENSRHGVADDSPEAVTTELVWFGDRPAHRNTNPSNVAIQAAWQAAKVVGVDTASRLDPGSSSLNDNVPAAIGVPTIDTSIVARAAGGGAHTFYEWGVPGKPALEAKRMQRILTAALIAAGFHAADGTVIEPAAPPIGNRTAELADHEEPQS
ncbi:MAG TPA: peptidase M20 [Burkholderiaceae bacterium]|nr:peptidase M20 [Burkholderiaceae bacterium]